MRLLAVPVWLLGTLVLFTGYATQGAALDRGKLVVVQPLLVTTIVWALPLGHWLTAQSVVRRQVLGAVIVVIGLALFILVGDPDMFEERLTRPGWHVLVAALALIAALAGAVIITLANRETEMPGTSAAEDADGGVPVDRALA